MALREKILLTRNRDYGFEWQSLGYPAIEGSMSLIIAPAATGWCLSFSQCRQGLIYKTVHDSPVIEHNRLRHNNLNAIHLGVLALLQNLAPKDCRPTEQLAWLAGHPLSQGMTILQDGSQEPLLDPIAHKDLRNMVRVSHRNGSS